MDLGDSTSTAMGFDVFFEREGSTIETEALFQRQKGSSHL